VRKTFFEAMMVDSSAETPQGAYGGSRFRRSWSAPPAMKGNGKAMAQNEFGDKSNSAMLWSPTCKKRESEMTALQLPKDSMSTLLCVADDASAPMEWRWSSDRKHATNMPYPTEGYEHVGLPIMTGAVWLPKPGGDNRPCKWPQAKETAVASHLTSDDHSGAFKEQTRSGRSMRLCKAKREKLKRVAEHLVAEGCTQLELAAIPPQLKHNDFLLQKLQVELKRASALNMQS